MNIGLFGFGKVATSLIGLIKSSQTSNINIMAVHTRSPEKMKEFSSSEQFKQMSAEEVLADNRIDTVVDLIGNWENSKTYAEKALNEGKNFVTACRPLIANCGKKLINIAKSNRRHIRFGGSVGCGVPILENLYRLRHHSISRVVAQSNSCSNLILDSMRKGKHLSFFEALEDCKIRGIAEANPKDDIDGIDMAQKLSIMVLVGFGLFVDPSTINTRSLKDVDKIDLLHAQELGFRVRQLAIAYRFDDDLINLDVGPYLVGENEIFYNSDGAVNVFKVETAANGNYLLAGNGACPDSTALSVFSDIQHISSYNNAFNDNFFNPYKSFTLTKQHWDEIYIRINLKGRKNRKLIRSIVEKIKPYKFTERNSRISMISLYKSKEQIIRIITEDFGEINNDSILLIPIFFDRKDSGAIL